MKMKDLKAIWQRQKSVEGKFCCVHADRPSVKFYLGGHLCAECLAWELHYRRYNDIREHNLLRKNATKDRIWADKQEEKMVCGDSLMVLERMLNETA